VPLPQPTPAADTVVWFAIRRDRIDLSTTSQDSAITAADPNAVSGRVQAIEYQGSYVKVTIHRPGHEDVIAHLPDRAFFPIQVKMGDRVVARWSPEHVHLLHAQHARVDDGAVGMRPYGKEFDALPR
jgi:putative spermidine/putrescine transport system ATP-binding protein